MARDIVWEHLRAIRGDLKKVVDTQKDHSNRLTRIERRLVERDMDTVEMQERFDSLADRVERIERRLELRDEA